MKYIGRNHPVERQRTRQRTESAWPTRLERISLERSGRASSCASSRPTFSRGPPRPARLWRSSPSPRDRAPNGSALDRRERRPSRRSRRAGAGEPAGAGSRPGGSSTASPSNRIESGLTVAPACSEPAPAGAPARGSAKGRLVPYRALAPAARGSSPLGDSSRREPKHFRPPLLFLALLGQSPSLNNPS